MSLEKVFRGCSSPISATDKEIFAALAQRHFVEHRGCYVASGCEPAAVDVWLESTGGDRTTVESVLNHVHLWDELETKIGVEDGKRLLMYLGSCWQQAASQTFPSVHFVFDQFTEADDYGPTIYFYAVRRDSADA